MSECPGLSAAQIERLAVLLEELGEAQHAIGKVLRHGFDSRHPDGGPTNREWLERELGDVACAASLLSFAGDLSVDVVARRAEAKPHLLAPYLHHQAGGPF